MSVKISVIVPCYNVEKYIDECINSLINQTLKDIEIILLEFLDTYNVSIIFVLLMYCGFFTFIFYKCFCLMFWS